MGAGSSSSAIGRSSTSTTPRRQAARASRSYPPSDCGHEPSVAALVCDRCDPRREPHELSRRQAHPAQRIVPMRIEPHRQQNQLRSKLQEHALNRLIDPLVVGIGRASLERKIDGEAHASSRSGFIGRPGAGVVRVLMRRDDQYRRIVVETPIASRSDGARRSQRRPPSKDRARGPSRRRWRRC